MSEVWRWTPSTISEQLEFATDVRSSQTIEVRDSMKDATQYLTVNHVVEHAVAEEMRRLVRANPLGEWLVPEWPTASIYKTTSALAAATVLPVDDSAAYQVGQQVFVGTDLAYELAEVAALGVGEITITSGLVDSYVGTPGDPLAIAPILTCIAPAGITFAMQYPVTSLSVAFMSIVPVDLAQSSYPEYEDLPIMTDARVPFSPLGGSISQQNILFDSGFGAYLPIATEDFVRQYDTASFFDSNWADRFERRRFLHFMRGRDGEAWSMTGINNLPIVTNGGTSATVEFNGIPADLLGLHVVFWDGVNYYGREITGVLDAGENLALITFATVPDLDTSFCISFITRIRFDTDSFDLSYIISTNGLYCSFAVDVIEVP